MTEASISCRQVVARLTDYLDASLSPRDEQRIKAHLAGCPGCRTTLDELRLTITLLSRLPNAEPTADFLNRLPRHKDHKSDA